MSLHARADHPGRLSYVVKLHRDAGPGPAGLRGRVENLATGHRFEFADGSGLLAALAEDLASDGMAGAPAPDAAAAPPDAGASTGGLGGTMACLLLALACAAMLVLHPPVEATEGYVAPAAASQGPQGASTGRLVTGVPLHGRS